MTLLLLLVKFFGGLILFFGLGYLIGHLLKLNKYDEDMQKTQTKKIFISTTMKMIKSTTIK
jgi:hypothetical protein